METLEGILEETFDGPLDQDPNRLITVDDCVRAGAIVGATGSFVIGSLVGGAVGTAIGAALGVWLGRRSTTKDRT